MTSALTVERVRRDIEVLCRAGLDTASFVAEVDASLQRAVSYSAACFALVDPATRLLTGTFKFGDLQGHDEHDDEWGEVEFGGAEPTSFDALAGSGAAAVGMALHTGGDLDRSARMREFMRPHFDFSDELRLVARQGERVWGGVALFRDTPGSTFSAEEVAFLASLSDLLAAGLRAGLLADAGDDAGDVLPTGPAVLIVAADGALTQVSAGAQVVLAQLSAAANAASAAGVIASLVTRARRWAVGDTEVPPRSRVRLPNGRWLVLHASPLQGPGGASGDVVVTIEEARPPEIVPLVVAAFDLTNRERDVIQLVLQGVDTKEIAANLHMSAYTVQDHLKSIFEKAGVRSRRELMARVFFDQYVPRMGQDLAPSGWFAGP